MVPVGWDKRLVLVDLPEEITHDLLLGNEDFIVILNLFTEQLHFLLKLLDFFCCCHLHKI
jgi:hypothetical protein